MNANATYERFFRLVDLLDTDTFLHEVACVLTTDELNDLCETIEQNFGIDDNDDEH